VGEACCVGLLLLEGLNEWVGEACCVGLLLLEGLNV